MNRLFGITLGIVAFLVALTVHEYCHALVAYLMGDETARRAGRLTLNPMAHADMVGTILIPFVGAVSGLPMIGWAKPVPYNPYNLVNQKWGSVVVALAGPIANFILALVALIVVKLSLAVIGLPVYNLLVVFMVILATTNIFLGLFNFIPVHPLDGAKLLNAILDHPRYRRLLFFLETRGPVILLVIVLLDYVSPVPILGTIFGLGLYAAFSIFGLQHLLGVI